jgi:hypothetical protein
MRLMLLALGLLVAAGCKPPPPGTLETQLKRELKLWFSNQNQEGLARKDALRADQAMAMRNPALQAPTGTIYSQFTWEESGFIVENFHCQICSAKMLLPFPSAEYLCRSCGHCPYKVGHPKTNLQKTPCEICLEKGTGLPREPVEAQKRETFGGFEGVVAKDMFKVTKKEVEKGSITAEVRYVRRVWAFDDRASVEVSQKAVERALVDPSWLPTGGENPIGHKPGFHRPDTMYVGEMIVKFTGGEMTIESGPTEQPVRPWTDLLGSKN